MAAALLGKCIGLLALVLLFYSCCYAFRIRDYPGQTASLSAEQPQRATCTSIFGRCQEKTTTTSSFSRKWHNTPASRLASSARKPPVELTLSDDDDRGGTEEISAKLERTGRFNDRVAEEEASKPSKSAEVDEDEEDVVVEVEQDSVEEILSEEEVDEDSAEEDEQEDDGDDDVDDHDDDDGGDDKGDEDEVNDDDSGKVGQGLNDDGERRQQGRKERKLKVESKEQDAEDKEDERKGKRDPYGKVSKVTKIIKSTQKYVMDTEEAEKESEKMNIKKKGSLEKGRKETVAPPAKLGKASRDETHKVVQREDKEDKGDEDENDEGEKDDDEDEDDEEDANADADADEVENEDEDEDENDEEEKGGNIDEDEGDEDEEEEAVPTPPLRKLEKVRHADKDKVRSTESTPIIEKPKIEVKEQSKVEKKTEDSLQKVVEIPNKFVEKKSVESPAKPVETTKKVEPVKITKSESGSSKPKVTVKLEEKPKAPEKPEIPKTQVPVKEPEKTKVKTTSAQSATVKAAEVKRSDKDDSKARTKAHVEAPFTLAQLNDAILHVPTFVPNFTAVDDLECQQHGKIFLRQLRGYKLWALQMLDASAKIPSGLLRGNVNQLGDFDECLGVMAHVKLNDKTIKVQGKYCLANIDLHPSHPDMKLPVNMMQARAFIRGSMRDPGHFAPKFTTVNWALCLPTACSAEDAQKVLEQAFSEYNSTAGIKFTVDVDPNMCYVKQKSRSYSKETIGVLYFYAMIICLVGVATVRDYIVVSEGKGTYSERIIMSFSLRRTIGSLLKKGTSQVDITCIHGIRAFTTIVLYIAHQTFPISRLPFSNRIEFTEMANTPMTSILRASVVYTDAFLLLSGVLTAYNMTHEYKKRGEIRWFCRFIARYIRFTPALLAVVFWYAFVMEHTGAGPQWNSIIVPNAELCKSNAWTNLLYIQNFFPFEEMCASHTHHLALDMQLSLLAPMLVFFLECRPIIGILVIVFFVLLSATLRYIATMTNYLSLVIFHGMSVKHLYKTANLMYALPLHRATPYVFGVGLGVLLHYTGRNVKIHKVLVILGWLIAMALGSWSLFSPWHLARRDYVYDVEEATNYAVISPVLWALALCWFIFACYTNHGGKINKFLSSHWLVVVSRISYAVYLTQFAVFFYNVGTTRYSSEFQLHRAIDPLEAATVTIVSIVLTLLFDLPMQEIKSVLMESTDILNVDVSANETSSAQAPAEEQKSSKAEKVQEKKVYEEDEVASTGWDWQRDIVDGGAKVTNDILEDEEQVHVPILKKTVGRRKSFIAHDAFEAQSIPPWDRVKDPNKKLSREDDDENRDRIRRKKSGQRDYQESENDTSDLSRMQHEREEAVKRSRRSLSRTRDVKRLPTRDSENEGEYLRRGREEEEGEEAEVDDDSRRYRRSQSTGRSTIRDSDDYHSWEFVGKERSCSRGPDSKGLFDKSEDREPVQRQTRPPLSRSGDARRTFSSESEDEPSTQRRKSEKKHTLVEPRISDEEDWENELRIRRKQFMEKLTMDQPDSFGDEEELSSLRRRSSAEGKIALLKDPSATDNMDAWTVSLGSRVAQLGSSQERSEPEEDVAYMRRAEYRERAPPPREDTQSEEEVIWEASKKRFYTSSNQLTSIEDDDDVAKYNFVLTSDSRRRSLQDLSKLSQEDSDLADSDWNVVRKESAETLPRSSSTGLYKRESIIKSQASEEDPEYLLPERPKLVQQEREHPFKKAWQMQKSRSEEDSSAYVIKEPKELSKAETKPKEESKTSSERMKRELGGEQYEDMGSFADDESESISLARSRSTDTEENTRYRSKSEELESASTERSGSTGLEVDNGNTKSSDIEEDSLRSNWPSEDEQVEVYKDGPRSKSEEAEWSWEQEET